MDLLLPVRIETTQVLGPKFGSKVRIIMTYFYYLSFHASVTQPSEAVATFLANL